MADDLEDLRQRLVVRRKADGRSVYDEEAKAELVALCLKPGASVSLLARQCGVNANQLSRWLREHHQRRHRAVAATAVVPRDAFVAVPMPTDSMSTATHHVQGKPVVAGPSARLAVQARLPNGVVVDLRDIELQHVADLVETLGRMRCFGSTTA